MCEKLTLKKFTMVIITRCNLRCKLCCEYVPQNKPFTDITLVDGKNLLDALFDVVDYVDILHLSGGGEPFLHQQLAELVDLCMEHQDHFGKLMLFTNCTIVPSEALLSALRKYKDRTIVQVSCYGIKPEKEAKVLATLEGAGLPLKIEKYYGEEQSFGGWVDFGPFEPYDRTPEELHGIFENCAVTRDMGGNWRGRDGKVHWCSRAQRGTELGLLPDFPQDYVDLFDDLSREKKREKFRAIQAARYLRACDYCSGDQGTDDMQKRHPAAEQM